MRTLFIDTSLGQTFLGAYEGSSWLKLLHQISADTNETLFSQAKELFTTYPIDSFRRVVTCIGPGRLMALRIAAVAANQWAKGKESYSFYSLQLASAYSGRPTAYALRDGACALWSHNAVEVTTALPESTFVLGSASAFDDQHKQAAQELYTKAVEKFPTLADPLLKPTTLFDPPLWAPFSYALAKNEPLSKG